MVILRSALSESNCPACDAASLARSVRTDSVDVFCCNQCGHCVATHAQAPQEADYHLQYDQAEFLESLEQTRRRQGRLVVSLIRRVLADADEVVDFGVGRGWFLKACREAGMRRLAGVDTSETAVSLTREQGFDGAVIDPPEGARWNLPFGGLRFKPRVLAFLDVVEHFPPSHAVALLRDLLAEAGPQLALVVVKVPVRSGIFYRIAAMLSRFGMTEPLEQLYQVGTWPPHLSYFSQRSLSLFLEQCGLRTAVKRGDRDFEVGSLGDRVRALHAWPPALAMLGGVSVALGCLLTGWYDSLIVLARPQRPR